jgi:hypothetical protein
MVRVCWNEARRGAVMGQYTCTVTISNNTSATQKAVIQGISGNFLYLDGTTTFFGNVPIDRVQLAPGQGKSYTSDDKCVVHFFFYVYLAIDGNEPIVLPFDRSDDSRCLAGEWKYEPRG